VATTVIVHFVGSAGASPPGPIAEPSPEMVVDDYLRREFVQRDEGAAKALECHSPKLADVKAKAADLKSRKSTYGTKINSTWSDIRTSTVSATSVNVTVNIAFTLSDGAEKTSQSWTFLTAKEGSWKVCGGQVNS
jgi:hypothetical protein